MPRKRGTGTCACGCVQCHFAFLVVLLLVVVSFFSTLRFTALGDTEDRHVPVRRRRAKAAQESTDHSSESRDPSFPSLGHGAPLLDPKGRGYCYGGYFPKS